MRLPIAVNMDVETNDVSVSMDIEPNYIDSVSGIVESSAYAFKASPHNGKYMMIDKIIGGTVEWNQLILTREYTSTSAGVTFTQTNDGAVAISGTASSASQFNLTDTAVGAKLLKNNHIYIGLGAHNVPSDTHLRLRLCKRNQNESISTISQFVERGMAVMKVTLDGTEKSTFARFVGQKDDVYDITVYPQLFDLTSMFGNEIAEYVLALETARIGAGVAWFKSMFPKRYYNYDAGTLRSVMTSAHETIGLNQWDEEWEIGTIDTNTGINDAASGQIRAKNLTRVMQGVEYYIKAPSAVTAYWYDYNGEYIGYDTLTANAVFTIQDEVCYMRFVMTASTYLSNICINVSGSRNGEYAGYKRRAYLLDGNTIFRGIPKLDQNNAIYYNGDEYCPSGKVKRKYGFVDIGTLNWYYLSTRTYFYAAVPLMKSGTDNVKILGYTMKSSSTQAEDMVDFEFCVSNRLICLHNSSYENIVQFKSSVQGTYMVFELEEQSIEKAEPYKSYQLREPGGTEGFVDTRTPSIPVGIESVYEMG